MDKIGLIFLTFSIFTMLFIDLFRKKKSESDSSNACCVDVSGEAFAIIEKAVSTEDLLKDLKLKSVFSDEEKKQLRKLLINPNLEIRDQAFSMLSRDIKELPFLLEKGRQEEISLLKGLEKHFLQGRRFSNYERFFQTRNLSFLGDFSGSLQQNSDKAMEDPYLELGYSTLMLEQLTSGEPSNLPVTGDFNHQKLLMVSEKLEKEASGMLSQIEFSEGIEKFRAFLEQHIERTSEPEVQFFALLMSLNELEKHPGILLPESIFPALDSQNAFIRGLALIVGSRIPASRVIREKIHDGLNDKESYVRSCAVSALAQYEGENAFQALSEIIRNEYSEEVSLAAAGAMRRNFPKESAICLKNLRRGLIQKAEVFKNRFLKRFAIAGH